MDHAPEGEITVGVQNRSITDCIPPTVLVNSVLAGIETKVKVKVKVKAKANSRSRVLPLIRHERELLYPHGVPAPLQHAVNDDEVRFVIVTVSCQSTESYHTLTHQKPSVALFTSLLSKHRDIAMSMYL